MGQIFVYGPFCDDFTTIGECGPLDCVSAKFVEEANGNSELTIEHPIDPMGRWSYLKEGYILQADVPVRTTPEIKDGAIVTSTQVWKVKTVATKGERTVYSAKSGGKKKFVLDIYSDKAKTKQTEVVVVDATDSSRYKIKLRKGYGWVATTAIEYVRTPTELESKPEAIELLVPAWSVRPQLFRIQVPDIRDDGVTIKARHISYDLLGNNTTYDPKRTHPDWNSSTAYVVGDVMSYNGVVYFCNAANTNRKPQSAWSSSKTYYLGDVAVYNGVAYVCRVPSTTEQPSNSIHWLVTTLYWTENATCGAALAGILDNCAEAHDFIGTTNVADQRVFADWIDVSPLDALLSPETGLLAIWGADLVRDDWEIKILDDAGLNRGVRIEYRKNLKAVKCELDVSNLITAIKPIGQTKKGKPLYLVPGTYTVDGQTVVVDTSLTVKSPTALADPTNNSYAVPHIYPLDLGDAAKATDTTSAALLAARNKMIKACLDMFKNEKCDIPQLDMTVDFLALANTEEGKLYAQLENVYLFDRVTVWHPKLGIDILTSVKRLEFDPILEHFTAIEVGPVRRDAKRKKIPSWKLPPSTDIAYGVVDAGSLADGVESELDMTTNPSVAQVAQENVQNIRVTGEQVFKYPSGSSTPELESVTLLATLKNVAMGKWQYKNGSDWVDYPVGDGNTTNTDTTLVVKPGHSAWSGNALTVRALVADASMEDSLSVYKVSDGSNGLDGADGNDGQNGSNGLDAITSILSHPAHVFPKTAAGAITYSGSGTTLRVLEGAVELDFLGTGTDYTGVTAGTWKCGRSPSGITPGAVSITGSVAPHYLTNADATAISGMSATMDFVVYGKRINGTAFTLTVRQSFSVVQSATDAPLIVGTQSSSTSSWTGVAPFASLVDGQQIAYKLPQSSTANAVTLNLSLLGGGSTGAINCYYGGTTRITSHYVQGSVIRMTYFAANTINGTNYAGWWADANYDTNTYDRFWYNRNVSAKTAITSGYLIVSDDTDKFFHLAKDVPFSLDKPILFASSPIAAGGASTTNYVTYPLISARTNSGNSSLAFVSQRPLYVKGTMSGQLFTPTDANLYVTTPTDDGSIYLLIGQLSDTYQFTLYAEHNLYAFKNGVFLRFSSVAGDTKQVGIESVTINETDGLRVDATLSNGETVVPTYFNAKSTKYGLFRTSDGKLLQGALVLPDGDVAGVSDTLIESGSNGENRIRIQTGSTGSGQARIDTAALRLIQPSFEGATDENPVATGEKSPVRIVARRNTYLYLQETPPAAWYKDNYLVDFRGFQQVRLVAEDQAGEDLAGFLVEKTADGPVGYLDGAYDCSEDLRTMANFAPVTHFSNPTSESIVYNATVRRYMLDWQNVLDGYNKYTILMGGVSSARKIGTVIQKPGLYRFVFHVDLESASSSSAATAMVIRMDPTWTPPIDRNYILDTDLSTLRLGYCRSFGYPISSSLTSVEVVSDMYCDEDEKIVPIVSMYSASKTLTSALTFFTAQRIG